MSELIRTAAKVATLAHTGQYRKYTGLPYIIHPLNVANSLSLNGYGDEMVAAGLLHDVLEDTDLTYSDLIQHVPEQVVRYVEGLTNQATSKETANWLRSQPQNVHIIKAYDILDNVSDVDMLAFDSVKGYEKVLKYVKSKIVQVDSVLVHLPEVFRSDLIETLKSKRDAVDLRIRRMES